MQKTLREMGLTELNATEMAASNGGNNTDPLYTIIKELFSGGGGTTVKTTVRVE